LGVGIKYRPKSPESFKVIRNYTEEYGEYKFILVINVKNFHRSLTTVARALNDTSIPNIIDIIFNGKTDTSQHVAEMSIAAIINCVEDSPKLLIVGYRGENCGSVT